MYDNVESRMIDDFPSKCALVKQHHSAGRLLDVGCGKGYFVKHCVDAGIDAQGVDLSTTAIEFATKSLGINAIAGRVEDMTEYSGAFETVTMWATIEHLPAPELTLKAIHRVLKPNGLLHLDTGIGADWLDKLLPGVNQWYDPPQHLFVFSASGLRKILEKTGFEVIRADLSYERNATRRFAKAVRSMVAALGLHAAARVGLARRSMETMSRFPFGNLQSFTARKVS
jgi:ubiquinone/menaquinone biosynthesis C-methylase UbiE